MSKIRVIIIDDSVVIRRCLSNYLADDPDIEVIATAADGEIGLTKIAYMNPDLVVLDIEMPVLDGLETLKAIRKLHDKLPVIMFSTLTERGAAATLHALSLGASDYATKSNYGTSAREHIGADLVPKIKALCHRGRATHPAAVSQHVQAMAAAAMPHVRRSTAPIEIVAIGASTGGPNALATLVAGLAPNLPVPVVIVQHMPQLFTRLLAERLATLSTFQVLEGKPGEVLRPGEIWIAPGGFHMDVVKSPTGVHLRTHKGELENSCRPAVDVLFRSVAQAYGPRVLAVVLTGMGQDGLLGCESICAAGGRVVAQDEKSSVVWGMPGAVTRAGLADKVLPLEGIAGEINRLVSIYSRTASNSITARAKACAACPVEII